MPDYWRRFGASSRLNGLERCRAAMPLRVPVSQVVEGEVVRLATERQHLSNCLKMVAYQAESDLARLIAPHYRRAEDEGHTLIQTALGSRADINVSGTELEVVLAPMSSPHRSRAVAGLCETLNAEAAVFPGSKLSLRYRVAAQN